MKKSLSLFTGVFIIFLVSCEDITDYYIGFNQQPDLLSDDFTAGLNIFGIIRPDTVDGINQSFVHVQKVIRAVGDTTSDLEIKNANVSIFSYVNSEVMDSFQFIYSNDSTKKYNQYKPETTFTPSQNQTFELKCTAEGLPELGAITLVPNVPNILVNSLIVTDKKVEFEIAKDTTAFMYLIYLLQDNIPVFNSILIPAKGENTLVNISAGIRQGTDIAIYAYDKNLANYIANSNTALNINKFRQYDNQVTGGYGVFGSLNFKRLSLK